MAGENDTYFQLREKIVKSYSAEEVEQIDKAYKIAEKAHEGQKRFSGQPYIIHPVAVASILVDLFMDYQSIVAALLHDTVEDTVITIQDVTKEFGTEVANIVDGVTKLGKVPFGTKQKEEVQAENIRNSMLNLYLRYYIRAWNSKFFKSLRLGLLSVNFHTSTKMQKQIPTRALEAAF